MFVAVTSQRVFWSFLQKGEKHLEKVNCSIEIRGAKIAFISLSNTINPYYHLAAKKILLQALVATDFWCALSPWVSLLSLTFSEPIICGAEIKLSVQRFGGSPVTVSCVSLRSIWPFWSWMWMTTHPSSRGGTTLWQSLRMWRWERRCSGCWRRALTSDRMLRSHIKFGRATSWESSA